MGIKFKYICDRILRLSVEFGTCDFCELQSDLYCKLIDDDAGNITDAACEACIRSLPLDWLTADYNEQLVRRMARERFPSRHHKDDKNVYFAKTLEEFRRTPDLPNLITWGQWPYCCSDFTEYIGDAGLTYLESYEDFTWFGPEDHCDLAIGLKKLASSPNLQSMDPISLFRCLTCSVKYWTHYV